MIFWMSILMAAGTVGSPITFEPGVRLSTVPEETEHFLERPVAFDIDERGAYFVVDADARVVYSWDKNGVFQRVIGKPGRGPGEFVFAGRGQANGFISAVGEKLYIYDGAKQAILVFDHAGVYQLSIRIGLSRGRASNFRATADGRFLLHRRVRKDDGLFSEIQLFSSAGEPVRMLKSLPDTSFRPRGGGGRRRGFSIKAFNPTLVSDFNAANGELLIGNSAEPFFEVYHLDGGRRMVETGLTREDVTARDRQEFETRFQNVGRGRVEITYPDKKPFYDKILSLGEKGYLAYTQSPVHGRLSGVHLDAKGNPKGRFRLVCGQDGGLLAAKGRMLSVVVNDEGEFELTEMSIK